MNSIIVVMILIFLILSIVEEQKRNNKYLKELNDFISVVKEEDKNLDKKSQEELIKIVKRRDEKIKYLEEIKPKKWYKRPMNYVAIVTIIFLIFENISIFGFTSDVEVIDGGEDIIPLTKDISENKGYWSIRVKNEGLGSSSNIILNVRFSEGVLIDEESIEFEYAPTEPTTNNRYEFKYTWDTLGSNQEISVSFNIVTPNSTVEHHKIPEYVEVINEKGLVYSYP